MASRRGFDSGLTLRTRRVTAAVRPTATRPTDPVDTGPTSHTAEPNPGPAIITPAPNGDAMPRANTFLTGPEGFGFINPNPAGSLIGDSTPGGGAPAWACAMIGKSQCSVAELIAAGLGHLFGTGGSEPPTSQLQVPSGNGPCPGFGSVWSETLGRCINLGDLGPGGAPALTAPVGEAVHGRYGVGVRPGQETITRAKCPAGFALGKDGVCYEGLHRNSPRRMWPMGQKPLMTAGDRSAIRRASKVANKLKREKKALRKASRALDKVC